MTKLGHRLNISDMVNVHPGSMVSLEESFDQAAALVENGVSAIICAADHQAYDLMQGLKQRGINIPRDVSICGFDGIVKPEMADQICTVKIPNYDIGYYASERLFEHSKKRFSTTHHTLLGCNLIKGNTIKTLNLNKSEVLI